MNEHYEKAYKYYYDKDNSISQRDKRAKSRALIYSAIFELQELGEHKPTVYRIMKHLNIQQAVRHKAILKELIADGFIKPEQITNL